MPEQEDPTTGERDVDRDLVRRLEAGDNTAFEELVSKYSRWLYTLVYRMVGERDVAEDLVQDIWLRAYKHIPSSRGTSTFSAFITAVARNVVTDHLRRTRKNKAETIEIDVLPSVTTDVESPETIIEIDDLPIVTIDHESFSMSQPDLRVVFDPDLSGAQVKATLENLADYYRACGGLGIEAEFDGMEATVREAALV